MNTGTPQPEQRCEQREDNVSIALPSYRPNGQFEKGNRFAMRKGKTRNPHGRLKKM